jgi:hypothetical protein
MLYLILWHADCVRTVKVRVLIISGYPKIRRNVILLRNYVRGVLFAGRASPRRPKAGRPSGYSAGTTLRPWKDQKRVITDHGQVTRTKKGPHQELGEGGAAIGFGQVAGFGVNNQIVEDVFDDKPIP